MVERLSQRMIDTINKRDEQEAMDIAVSKRGWRPIKTYFSAANPHRDEDVQLWLPRHKTRVIGRWVKDYGGPAEWETDDRNISIVDMRTDPPSQWKPL